MDHHRALRQGCPEVIFGAGKSAAQIVAIATEVLAADQNVLITRLEPDKARQLEEAFRTAGWTLDIDATSNDRELWVRAATG